MITVVKKKRNLYVILEEDEITPVTKKLVTELEKIYPYKYLLVSAYDDSFNETLYVRLEEEKDSISLSENIADFMAHQKFIVRYNKEEEKWFAYFSSYYWKELYSQGKTARSALKKFFKKSSKYWKKILSKNPLKEGENVSK